MAIDSKIAAESRADTGSTVSRRFRREGWIPGVVNNEKCESKLVRINQHDFEMVLHAHRSENVMVDLSIDSGDAKKVFLREVQHDPLSGEPLHAEFFEVSLTRKMSVSIPVVLVGEPKGVVQDGGRLEHLLREIEVECLPTDLVESIEVDVSDLEIGDVLTVADMKIDSKFDVENDEDEPVATIAVPQAEEEPEEEGEEGAEGVLAAEGEGGAQAEPEVIGEKEREEKAEAQDKSEG